MFDQKIHVLDPRSFEYNLIKILWFCFATTTQKWLQNQNIFKKINYFEQVQNHLKSQPQ